MAQQHNNASRAVLSFVNAVEIKALGLSKEYTPSSGYHQIKHKGNEQMKKT